MNTIMERIKTTEQLESALGCHTVLGGRCYVQSRRSPWNALKYTDGVRDMAVLTGAYWLIQAVCSYMPYIRKHSKLRRFALVRLSVLQGRGNLDILEDSHDGFGIPCKPVIRQQLEYVEFPEGIFELFLKNELLMLKTER